MAFDYSVAHIQLSPVKSGAKTLKPIEKSSHDCTSCFTVAVEVIILKAGESDVLLQRSARGVKSAVKIKSFPVRGENSPSRG